MMSARARAIAHGKDQTVEILTTDEGQPKEAEPPEPKPEPTAEAKKPEPPKPEEKPKEEAPKPEVKVVQKPEDPLKKLDEEILKKDNRIAVKQHADKNQQDNPNA